MDIQTFCEEALKRVVVRVWLSDGTLIQSPECTNPDSPEPLAYRMVREQLQDIVVIEGETTKGWIMRAIRPFDDYWQFFIVRSKATLPLERLDQLPWIGHDERYDGPAVYPYTAEPIIGSTTKEGPRPLPVVHPRRPVTACQTDG